MDLYTLGRFARFALPYVCGGLVLYRLLYGLAGDWSRMPFALFVSTLGMLVWFGMRKYLP